VVANAAARRDKCLRYFRQFSGKPLLDLSSLKELPRVSVVRDLRHEASLGAKAALSSDRSESQIS
jgi:hypothetical protein